MSYGDFWDGEVDIAKYYIAMFKEKVDKETERQFLLDDRLAWLMGHYFGLALASGFSKKTKYPKEPEGIKNYERRKATEKLQEEDPTGAKQAELYLKMFDAQYGESKDDPKPYKIR